jgi:hypothetical protein
VTRNPKRTLRFLWISLVIVGVIWLGALLLSRQAASPAPPTLPPLPDACTLALSRELEKRGVAAAVIAGPGAALHVRVPYTPPPDSPPDAGAQVMWAVFDAAVTLPPECSFEQLRVVVHTGNVELHAAVGGETLRAWGTGALSDEGLADDVLYTQATPAPP